MENGLHWPYSSWQQDAHIAADGGRKAGSFLRFRGHKRIRKGRKPGKKAGYVHVCGEVKRPGVYELKEGQRVYEAVHLAGGFTDQAAESYLNLAQPVEDGMKLEVPNRDQAPEPEWPKPGESPKTQAKVNLNKASKEELMALRGIGEAKAEDIIRYREEQGGFNCIEDIMNISGIKDAAFQKIKEEITV